MTSFSEITSRTIKFIKSNPQIIYTLFLAVAIPLAFVYTSEKFLKVARDNQDRLERSRIGMLEEAFAFFVRDHLHDAGYVQEQIKRLSSQNQTIMTFDVIGRSGDGKTYPMLASLDESSVGTAVELDGLSRHLMSLARTNPEQSYATPYYNGGIRYWRSVGAILATGTPDVAGFVIVDLSMANTDAIARANVKNAYWVLGIIVILIIILLARQAKVIDYATLYAKLKDVDKMKDDFVSMAAHELRSPLTIIRGYTDMLKSGEKITDAGKGYLDRIDVAAKDLNGLIGDILDVAKLQEGRMSFQLEPLDVSTEIASLVDSFVKPAEDKGLRLLYEATPLPKISVDKTRFHQVMVNLVGNAIKYTPKGEVRVITEEKEGIVSIRVSDTGLGISAEDQKKLFQKFYRVKSDETAKITGTGLGLWITDEIVRQMKGTISVESIKGKGTDFILNFPIAK